MVAPLVACARSGARQKGVKVEELARRTNKAVDGAVSEISLIAFRSQLERSLDVLALPWALASPGVLKIIGPPRRDQ